MNWESICSLCSDADLIVDDGLAETLIWHGGLSNLVSFGALSCQSLSENVKSNGPNGVILLSSPLMGDMVVTIQKIMESCTWKNVTIITASSGLLHLMLHKVEDQFSEEEVFDQFKSKVLEWNPNGACVRVCSATQMEVIDFKWSGEDRFTLINKPTPFLKPLLLQSLKQDGSSPYFSLESADQVQISDFAETVRQRLHNQNIQGDIWSCGDLASMIGSRLQKYQSKFDNKVAVVIFDRQIQFHADRNKESGNGLDDLIFHSEIEGRTNLKSKLLGFKTNITLPSSDRENSLYSALFDNTLEYAYTLAQNLFEQIFEEEGIDFKADGMLSTCLESIQKHTEAIMYNAGFISLCQLIEDAHSKNTISTSTSSLENLKANLDEYTPSQNIYNVINLLSTTEVDPDSFQIFTSSFCLYLHQSKHVMDGLDEESDLEDIIDVISPKLEYLYANINDMKSRYGDLSFSLIIENLFSGLPLPNFMKHHAEGLMGKLSSGFGLFGGAQEKTISDYQKIIFVFAGGLNFCELKSIKRNEMISL